MYSITQWSLDLLLFLCSYLPVAALQQLGLVSVHLKEVVSVHARKKNELLWEIGQLARLFVDTKRLTIRYCNTIVLTINGCKPYDELRLPQTQRCFLSPITELRELCVLRLESLFYEFTPSCWMSPLMTLEVLDVYNSVSRIPRIYYYLETLFPNLMELRLTGAKSISQFRCYIARNCVGFSRLERLVVTGNYRYFYMFQGYCATLRYFELRNVHWQSRYQVCTYADNVPVGNKQHKDIDELAKRFFSNAKFVHNLSPWDADCDIRNFKW